MTLDVCGTEPPSVAAMRSPQRGNGSKHDNALVLGDAFLEAGTHRHLVPQVTGLDSFGTQIATNAGARSSVASSAVWHEMLMIAGPGVELDCLGSSAVAMQLGCAITCIVRDSMHWACKCQCRTCPSAQSRSTDQGCPSTGDVSRLWNIPTPSDGHRTSAHHCELIVLHSGAASRPLQPLRWGSRK